MSDELIFDRPFIAYDGSPSCLMLIQIFKKMHSKFEQTNIVHVWSPNKNYIPYPSQGPQIQESLKQLIAENNKQVTIKLVQKQKQETKTINELLLQSYFGCKSTFMMFGFYGSKGAKVRAEDLSSRARRFVYDSKLNVAIVKNQLRGTNNVGFCCDGSEISLDGLNKCLVFCKKFGYCLKIIHSYNQATKALSKVLKNQLKSLLSSTDVKYEIIMEQNSIIQAVKSRQQTFDWLFLTRNGYRGEITKKTYVGSKTTDLLIQANANIFIVS